MSQTRNDEPKSGRRGDCSPQLPHHRSRRSAFGGSSLSRRTSPRSVSAPFALAQAQPSGLKSRFSPARPASATVPMPAHCFPGTVNPSRALVSLRSACPNPRTRPSGQPPVRLGPRAAPNSTEPWPRPRGGPARGNAGALVSTAMDWGDKHATVPERERTAGGGAGALRWAKHL